MLLCVPVTWWARHQHVLYMKCQVVLPTFPQIHNSRSTRSTLSIYVYASIVINNIYFTFINIYFNKSFFFWFLKNDLDEWADSYTNKINGQGFLFLNRCMEPKCRSYKIKGIFVIIFKSTSSFVGLYDQPINFTNYWPYPFGRGILSRPFNKRQSGVIRANNLQYLNAHLITRDMSTLETKWYEISG